MTEESAVKVCVRVRPLIRREVSENAEPVQLYWKADKQAIHQIDDDGNLTKTFSFDRVFNAEESTNQLYQDIAKPLVVSTVEGYNGTIFAYGQTSSGKTFTMMGSEHIPGVIPLAMADVFLTIKNCPKKEFLLRVSYMEIYNETVTDLLCESWKRKPLEIREGNYKNVYVADLTEELVTSPEQALAWIRKGEKNRHYGKTKMNERSSRSHTIFRMILESRERSDPASGESADGAIIVSHLNLVDLAGAERASQTGAEGARLKEGCNINRSLFTLGQVIKKLSDESQKGFTNYRDSKLTRILQNSLGGNAKTVIICTITPATVDETVSTLQFASAAKRMKNDPHVTEVSDDGALLRRYRNEIVDLKRRLHEVSSVTQTTVTEKESLTQLLQEKEQLQREQADRIRNLTKLLVTASNVVQVQKVPKRRVTWGGKLLRSAQLVAEDQGSSDMSFAEPYFKKRRADLTVTEEGDEMDDFDQFYSTTDDTAIELEMNQSTVMMRSPAESLCPDSPQLVYRVESLERQLETETREKQRAEEKSSAFEQRTEELEKQLQASEQQLKVEVEEKQKAEEKFAALEVKVADLEKPSGQEKTSTDCEQESIATELDVLKQTLELQTEDIERLKQDNEALLKDKEALQKDKETVLKEIEERNDADEFEKLEQESKKDYERELEAEISALKKASADTQVLVQKLKADLETLSGKLRKKEDLVTELQTMNGKDLVQEVTRLRRSLDDAEGLNLETKREWAFLRSENMSLKERDGILTAEHGQMETEVKSLQHSLENEKARFKKMQADLQKELLVAFDENTKLTSLLDGKVPKNLLENLVLEKRVADLRKELEKSQESETALQSKLDELKPLELLPAKVDDLLRQVCELSEELYSVQGERDGLVSAQANSTEEKERLVAQAEKAQQELGKMLDDLAEAELKESQLSQQHRATTEQLAQVQADLERLSEENARLLTTLEEANQKSVQLGEEVELLRCAQDAHPSEPSEDVQKELQTLRSELTSTAEERDQLQEALQVLKEEKEQLKTDMEENVEMMIENQEELRTTLEKVKQQKEKILTLEAQKDQLESKLSHSADGEQDGVVEELKTQVKQLQEDLQSVCADRDSLLSEKSLCATEELERMQASIGSLTEERDQLREILQGLREERTQLNRAMEEKVEMIIQFQSELNKEQVTARERHFTDSVCISSEREESLLQQIEDLKRETTEMTQQDTQLRTELQTMSDKVDELSTVLHTVQGEKDDLLAVQSTLNEANLRLKEDVDKVQDELVKMESQMIDSQLKEAEVTEQHTQTSEQLAKVQADLELLTVEKNQLLTSLEQANLKAAQWSEELESLRCDRGTLLSEKVESAEGYGEEVVSLRAAVTSVTEERNQLQENLQTLMEEQNQLKRELNETSDQLLQVQDKLKQDELGSEQANASVQDELLQQVQQLQERLESVTQENQQLKTDVQENVEMMIENQEELRGALANIKELKEKIRDLEVQRDQLESKLSQLECSEDNQLVEDLKTQVNQLNKELEAVCEEKDRLLSENSNSSDHTAAELERVHATLTVLAEERDQLLDILQGLRDEKSHLKNDLEEKDELIVQMREELRTAVAETDGLCAASKDSIGQDVMDAAQANITALGEERDQLLEILQVLRDEKSQLKSDLDEKEEQIMQLSEELQSASTQRDDILGVEGKDDVENAALETIQASMSSLGEERDQLLEVLQGLRDEKSQMKSDLEEKDDMVVQLNNQLCSVAAERDDLLCARSRDDMDGAALETIRADAAALSEERDQLLEILQNLRDEKCQLKNDLVEKDDLLMQLRTELQSISSEKELLLAEQMKHELDNKTELERYQDITSLTEEKDQIKEENKQLQTELDEIKDKVIQLRDELQSATTEREHLLCEKTTENLAHMSVLEQMRTDVSSLNEERDQLLEIMQGLRDEKNQLKKELEEMEDVVMQLRKEVQSSNAEKDRLLAENDKCNLDNTGELERLQANITSLTEERDRLLELLQGMREDKNQIREELDKKEELILQLKKLQCSASNDSGSSANVNEDDVQLQELLQGVRELIQVQGKQKQQDSNKPSLGERQETEHQQIQALKDKVETLKSERTTLRKDLQEAAEMSKAYQNLLHSTKEELKQQQKENSDLMVHSAEKEEQLQQQIYQLNTDLESLSEQLLAVKTSETQNLNTELQNLQTHITSLMEEKEKFQEMLECTREEGASLRNELKESEERRLRLTDELECLGGVQDQLLHEKTRADQVREERDQIRRELEERVDELTHTEEKVQGLEKQNVLLQSEVSSLNQSLHEMNENADVASNENRVKVMSEIETCSEKLKTAFLKLQTIIDRPTPKDSLAEGINREWSSFCQLLPFIPKTHRTVCANLTAKTTQLNDVLVKTAETLKRLAQRHKSHFMVQVQRDVASFEERRLLDVLIRRAQTPSQSLQTLQENFQQIWDQRLSELLGRRKLYLQDMKSILEVLEDAAAKHAVTLSEEHQAQSRAYEEIKALSRTADAAAIIQFFERELARRAALVDRLRVFRKGLLDKYDSAVSTLKSLEAESEQRLNEERRDNLTLLAANNVGQPKTEAELLQDKQRLTLQLQQTQKQMEVVLKKMEELKTQEDVSNKNHVIRLQELNSDLKEKEYLIQILQAKLKETETLAKVKMPPSAAEMEAMKDKLMKMELDHIAVTTGHEKEITQLTSVLEHREEVNRKLKENLRKTQQEDERSFVEGEEPHPKAGTHTKTHAGLKEKKIDELERKTAHFESLVSKQQEEISKWKSRAYKLRESKKEAPHSPRTPSKRHPPLTETEVNSPKKVFLDSPKSKFFDVRAGAEAVSLKCPKQFFDNSSLGTMPDPPVTSSGGNVDSWFHIPNSSPRKTNTNMDANGCPTQ
ncbi:centromere-associated protein E isoform X2 [Trichomycterus rosablanca]|uniref:centromere-associated protein E isoform X2 n=1 Tax=Trichomycterus rosablanca TaxID=2290929 RepID=UPI002F358A2C